MSDLSPGSPLTKKIRTYCAQCFSNCPVVAHVENGKFTKVTPDRLHRFYRPLCPKGLAGPEMVYNSARLRYPLKRTAPKGYDDPGWQRISWKEALDTVADKMQQIKERHGAEAFVFSQTNVSSPMWEIASFIRRLANLYGTPNHMTTTHICNWHRDNGSALTFGKPGDEFAAGWPDFKHSKSILLWGHNPKTTMNAFNCQIKTARKNGAKIIVIDPRLTDVAAKADIWLQVKPGTDGALALGMIHLMLKHKLYDDGFVRNWTNAPLLVRNDTKDLARAFFCDKSSEKTRDSFWMVDEADNTSVPFTPGSKLDCRPCLEWNGEIKLPDQAPAGYKTVFSLLKESVAMYTPEFVQDLTSVSGKLLEKTVRMMAENGPSSWFSFNGVEQNLNATQTNRAICIFYALTGDWDKKGGNTLRSPLPPLDYPFGFEFITPEMFNKNMALSVHPLGPAASIMSVPPYLVCKAIEQADPYPVKGLIVFGANTVSANPDSKMTAKALKKLDFHVHIDLTINPTAEFADIVLPSASFWETGRMGYPLDFQEDWVLQWREPVAVPRDESKDELWIIFELARRLGFSDDFWDGKLDAAFESMLAPLDIELEDLKKADGGIFVQGPRDYQKYKKDGFGNMSGRVELFSQHLKDIGQAPVPEWRNPCDIFQAAGIQTSDYPFLLINSKLRGYCHSQHRAIPSLRKLNPYPFLEINEKKAKKMGIAQGDPVALETVYGKITLQARLSNSIAQDVVCTQHGWWQACPELGLPGNDVFSSSGANVNLLYKNDFTDPISGSVHMRGFPCKINKLK